MPPSTPPLHVMDLLDHLVSVEAHLLPGMGDAGPPPNARNRTALLAALAEVAEDAEERRAILGRADPFLILAAVKEFFRTRTPGAVAGREFRAVASAVRIHAGAPSETVARAIKSELEQALDVGKRDELFALLGFLARVDRARPGAAAALAHVWGPHLYTEVPSVGGAMGGVSEPGSPTLASRSRRTSIFQLTPRARSGSSFPVSPLPVSPLPVSPLHGGSPTSPLHGNSPPTSPLHGNSPPTPHPKSPLRTSRKSPRRTTTSLGEDEDDYVYPSTTAFTEDLKLFNAGLASLLTSWFEPAVAPPNPPPSHHHDDLHFRNSVRELARIPLLHTSSSSPSLTVGSSLRPKSWKGLLDDAALAPLFTVVEGLRSSSSPLHPHSHIFRSEGGPTTVLAILRTSLELHRKSRAVQARLKSMGSPLARRPTHLVDIPPHEDTSPHTDPLETPDSDDHLPRLLLASLEALRLGLELDSPHDALVTAETLLETQDPDMDNLTGVTTVVAAMRTAATRRNLAAGYEQVFLAGLRILNVLLRLPTARAVELTAHAMGDAMRGLVQISLGHPDDAALVGETTFALYRAVSVSEINAERFVRELDGIRFLETVRECYAGSPSSGNVLDSCDGALRELSQWSRDRSSSSSSSSRPTSGRARSLSRALLSVDAATGTLSREELREADPLAAHRLLLQNGGEVLDWSETGGVRSPRPKWLSLDPTFKYLVWRDFDRPEARRRFSRRGGGGSGNRLPLAEMREVRSGLKDHHVRPLVAMGRSAVPERAFSVLTTSLVGTDNHFFFGETLVESERERWVEALAAVWKLQREGGVRAEKWLRQVV